MVMTYRKLMVTKNTKGISSLTSWSFMIGIIRIVIKNRKYKTGMTNGVLNVGSGEDFLYLSMPRLHKTNMSKPTLTNTNSRRRTPILLVMQRRIIVMNACNICAVTGVFECWCKRERNLGRWCSRDAAKQNLPFIKPEPKNDPKRERNTRKEKGMDMEDPARCEEKVVTIRDEVLISSIDRTRRNAMLTSK